MLPRVSTNDTGYLGTVAEAIRTVGCILVEDVLSPDLFDDVRAGIDRGLQSMQETLGAATLLRAGERGVVRAPMLASAVFFELLTLPTVLAIVDALLSPTAIVHVQNGFALPPMQPGDADVFQTRFHQDFPRVLNGYLCSINTLIAIDAFTPHNGATVVIPGSQQTSQSPNAQTIETRAVSAECPAGAAIVFDSTLWHAAGINQTTGNRYAVNQQFTRSYFKQQIDYVRCLGNEIVEALPPRTQQLLGWYTRVPASLSEYYREDRVYRSGQG